MLCVFRAQNVAWTLTDTPDTLNAARERMLGRGTMAALDTVKEQLLTHGDSDDKAGASRTPPHRPHVADNMSVRCFT